MNIIISKLIVPLVISIASWLIPWFALYAVHQSAEKSDIYMQHILPYEGDIITLDGNNLFQTGLFYTVLLIVAILVPWAWVKYGILILSILLCIPPIIGFFVMLMLAQWKSYPWQVKTSRFLCTFLPLTTSACLYIFAIK